MGEGKINKSEAIAELNNKRTPIKKHLELIEEKRKNMTVPCSKCGAEVRGDMKFCPHCGAAIEFTYAFFCPYCDVEIPDSKMKFCFNCGREFNTHTQHLQSETNTITYSTAASQPIESPTSFPTKTLPKPGCLLWIGAFYFPYFFIFSKHKSIKKFSLIWLIFIILFCIIMGNISQDSSTDHGVIVPQKEHPQRKVEEKKSDSDISLFYQLPTDVKAELKTIGIEERLGTELTRRRDLEDTNNVRCYRIRKSCVLPKGCNDTVHIYIKNGILHEVTYCGRTILGNGIKVHIKQAVVDFYYKYAKDKLYEIKELIQAGWKPSSYATGK